MKKVFIMALAAGLAVAACTPKQASEAEAAGADSLAPGKTMTAADYKPSKALVDSVSYLLGVNFGSIIKGNGFGDLNLSQMEKGINDFLKADGNPYDENFGEQFKIDPNTMGEIINGYLQKRSTYVGLQNKEAGEKYLASNLKKDGVQVTPSGLQYRIMNDGDTDLKPAPTDTVSVRYKGTTIDGKVFDETKEGADPAKFVLNRVIPGWTEGMQLVGKGGKIELYIPSELGYGERGTQGIEPNSTLVFEVELVDVAKFVAPSEE